jgi:multiple sugar transport system permease protein
MVGRQGKITKFILYIFLIGGAFFAGFPVLWMFLSSLKSNNQIFEWPPKFFDKSFSLNSYVAIISDPEKVRYFINSYAIRF